MKYKKGDKIVCIKIFRPDGDYWFGGPAKYRPGDTYEVKQVTEYYLQKGVLDHSKIFIGKIGEIFTSTDFLYLYHVNGNKPKIEDYFTDYLKYSRKQKLKKINYENKKR